jgi:hypothetical protein
MNTPLIRRFGLPLVLVAAALFGLACNETKTPTEPAASFNPPRPTQTPTLIPTPTPIPQPATLSGTVTKYSGPVVGETVDCQGRSATTSSSGAYNLTGLVAGTTIVTVTYKPGGEGYSYVFNIELKPGSNTVNLFLYE